MPDKQTSIQPSEIIELALRRRWFIIIPFCLSMIVGIFLELTLPKVYEANTMILVQPQRVPSNFVQSLITTDISQRVATIQQQILSRSNLEKVIEDFKLFSGPEDAKMFPEDKVANLMKRISVNVAKDRSRKRDNSSTFSISFKGEDPQTVMRVANSLASFFINENLRVREAQAHGTSDFLDDELKIMRKRLEETEEAMRSYRKKYMGALPEQLETNLRILDRFQAQMSDYAKSFRDAKSRIITLENRESTNLPNAQPIPDNASKLETMQALLADLKTNYTERHPDIISLKNKIENLEDEIVKANKEQAEAIPKPEESRTKPDIETVNQRNEVNRVIKTLQEDMLRLQKQIKIYQQRIEATPQREQELMSLKRDYENMKNSYSSLLNRKLEAEIAVNMEKKQKGEQFRIIDSARLPEKPISPDMNKIFMLSLAAGLGIGGGLIFLLFYLDSSFQKPEDIEAFLGIPILTTLPKVYHPKDLKRQKIHFALSLFSIIVSFVLLAGFAVLTINGVAQTKELVQKLITL